MSLQIFILGLLSEGEHHPYDIKKQVFKPLENTITINDGTLYYNFEVLLKKGYIRKIKVVQSENDLWHYRRGPQGAGRGNLCGVPKFYEHHEPVFIPVVSG